MPEGEAWRTCRIIPSQPAAPARAALA